MSKVSIETKLPAVGTSIFTVMSALALEHGALNLSQGFPDFPADPVLAELVTLAIREGYNQYAPSPGWMPLREEIASLVSDLYSANYNPETEVEAVVAGSNISQPSIPDKRICPLPSRVEEERLCQWLSSGSRVMVNPLVSMIIGGDFTG